MACDGTPGQQTQLLFPTPRQLFTPAVTALLALLAAGCILQSVAPGSTTSLFALDPRAALAGRFWQFVTFPFVNEIGGMLATGLLLLFLGSAIEREWRSRSFVALWVVVSAVCGLIWVAVCLIFRVQAVGTGGAACIYGLIGTYGLIYRRRAGWPLAPHHMALLILVVAILLSLRRPMTLIWISGAVVAFLYIRLLWRVRESMPTKPPTQAGRFRDLG